MRQKMVAAVGIGILTLAGWSGLKWLLGPGGLQAQPSTSLVESPVPYYPPFDGPFRDLPGGLSAAFPGPTGVALLEDTTGGFDP